MEVKNLLPVILIVILTIILTAMSVLILDKMGVAAKTNTYKFNEVVAFSGINPSGTTANDDVTSITSIYNTTGIAVPAINYTNNYTAAGVIRLNGNWTSGNYNVTYYYDADSASTTSFWNGRDATTTVNTQWMSILILIVISSTIISMLLGSFAQSGRR